MRLMDVILAFPSILLIIVIVTVLGPSLPNAMLAIGIVFIPQMARVVRSAVISVRERDYIEAERALGAGNPQIIFPGIAIALCVLSVNFIGDGLRDALDPRRRR